MPPRIFKKKSVKRLVEKHVAKAIEEYEKTRADLNNAGGSGSANTGGTVAPDVQGCSNVKAMMTTEYYPTTEIQKMEQELWTLTLKGDDIEAYSNRFHKLVRMCPELVPTENKKIQKCICGFPERIKGNITSSNPVTLHEAINMALELVEQSVQATIQKEGSCQAYAAAPAEGKVYAGNLPLCNKCKFYHNGQCTVKWANCKRVGHLTRDCWSPAATNNQRNLTCYECGNQGHNMSDFPELKNRNHGNQVRGTEARRMVHALVGGETNQNLNNMEDDINA
ncbi:putative reverse transcriptase domain-containing protein [Tanacetum coccineum]